MSEPLSTMSERPPQLLWRLEGEAPLTFNLHLAPYNVTLSLSAEEPTEATLTRVIEAERVAELSPLASRLLSALTHEPLPALPWAARRLCVITELLARTLNAHLEVYTTLDPETLDPELIKALTEEQSALTEGAPNVVVHLDTLKGLGRAPQRLLVELWCEPLGKGGPRVRFGSGQALSLHHLKPHQSHTSPHKAQWVGLKRDLHAELTLLTRARQLLDLPEREADSSEAWREELSAEEGVELIQRLSELEMEGGEMEELEGLSLRAEWPQGDAWAITDELTEAALSLNIRKVKGGAMSLSGSLDLGELGAAKLKDVTSLLADSPSRLVQLPSGVFLSLTSDFLQKLQALILTAPEGKATAATAPVIDQLQAARAQVKASQEWLVTLERRRASEHLTPSLPQGLNATLRHYQEEGFVWMSRLAHWGGGACLADDMGLGKTLQGLAISLARAEEGPTLVVAPTSVCGSWVEEARRFAPSLKVVRFGVGAISSASARARALRNLKAGDLVVCSYGLLGSEREALGARQWRTVILDEAQAIKNPSSLRHQAAIELKADFKVAMTGTPIENHLRDLWSLMRFLNPGLLGSQRRFRELFETPIEQSAELAEQRSSQLKELVAPFILRRTKREVLKELPSKTELNIPINLSDREAAQYEAIRSIAVSETREMIRTQKGVSLPHIFKVLTKLRLACCHPSLINDEWTGESAKFEHFKRLVTQLMEGGHKALVFSQFVLHLNVLEAWLQEQGIKYERLDGSTPAEERDRSVARFQRGEADLFLISLRAGGVGLTLTEADYVIHMDPWWNPAVEDQASDRAHRIGQERPVMVYRFIAEGTVEEKILSLHEQKRSLAEQLLEGSESIQTLNLTELMELL